MWTNTEQTQRVYSNQLNYSFRISRVQDNFNIRSRAKPSQHAIPQTPLHACISCTRASTPGLTCLARAPWRIAWLTHTRLLIQLSLLGKDKPGQNVSNALATDNWCPAFANWCCFLTMLRESSLQAPAVMTEDPPSWMPLTVPPPHPPPFCCCVCEERSQYCWLIMCLFSRCSNNRPPHGKTGLYQGGGEGGSRSLYNFRSHILSQQ